MINWRFGGWFFQVERFSDWRLRDGWSRRYGGPVRLSRLPGRPRPGEGWVSIYQGRVHFALTLLALVLLVLWVAS